VTARLERIVPIVDTPEVQLFPLPPVPRSDGGRAAAVLFEYGDLRSLEPGVYHLMAETRLASGETRADSWNIEIDPSTPAPPPGMPLRRMARWVSQMGDPDRLAGEPLVSERDLGVPAGDGTCGGSAHIGQGEELFGIIGRAGSVVGRVLMLPLDVVRSEDVAIRVATNVADGLTLVAVPYGGLPARQYMLIVDGTSSDGLERLVYTVCVT
jgi:hypothetical protein